MLGLCTVFWRNSLGGVRTFSRITATPTGEKFASMEFYGSLIEL
jgi:hypothetical protein